MKKEIIAFFTMHLVMILVNSNSFAQSDIQDTINEHYTKLTAENRPLKLHVFDYPLNITDGYYWPSWKQSIFTTKMVNQVAHKTIASLTESILPKGGNLLTYASIFTFNAFYIYLPTGYIWQHQESHRALLHYRGIQSFNQVYEFRFFKKRVATKNVKDEDLIRLKKDHPEEMARLKAAGHEGQLEMILAMKKDAFYYETPPYLDIIPYWLNTLIVVKFLNEFREKDYDLLIDERNKSELTIAERDISGVEFTPWVYDLFRPYEPYEMRGENGGVHPYGEGIDRYIGNSDLTDEEKKYLKLQSNLVWINFLSPHLFGFTRFKAKNPFNGQAMFWNINMMHHLTSFGYIVDFNAFYQQNKWNVFITYHNYKNKNKYFPGFDVEVIRYPIKKLFISGSIGGWIQPKNQLFISTSGTSGGKIKLGIDMPVLKNFECFIETEFKSEGWVAGNVSLEPAFQFSTGINWLY